MWMVHAVVEDKTKQKLRDFRRESGDHIQHPDAGNQPQEVKAHTYQLDPHKTLNHSPQGITPLLKRIGQYIDPETQMTPQPRQEMTKNPLDENATSQTIPPCRALIMWP
jgi:hypothetical protein